MPKHPLCIASCLIFDELGRLLLLRRHRDDLGGGMWAAPGGKQEADEDHVTTALREVEEETGIQLPHVIYLGAHELRMPHGVVHIKSFRAQVESNQKVTLNPDEHDSHKWLELSLLGETEKIIWGLPTTLRDFGLLDALEQDLTLTDGSNVLLLERAADNVLHLP